jgi:hypothetical protein
MSMCSPFRKSSWRSDITVQGVADSATPCTVLQRASGPRMFHLALPLDLPGPLCAQCRYKKQEVLTHGYYRCARKG